MTPAETKLLSGFMEELIERFSCDGCNDFELEDTPEHRALVAVAYSFDLEYSHRLHRGRILCSNHVLLEELHKRLLL